MRNRRVAAAALIIGLLGFGWAETGVASPSTEAAPTLTATPRTNLVHDQRIRVTTAGWQPRTPVLFFQCPKGRVADEHCTELRGGHLDTIRTGARGRTSTAARVDVILQAEHGQVDCRVRACVLVVARHLAPGARRGSVPLGFRTDGPDPVRPDLSVTPNADLVDGQTARVRSTEAGPDTGVVPCRLPVRSLDDCDLGREELVRGVRRLNGPVRLSAVIHPGTGMRDCRVEACALVALAHPRLFRIPLAEMPLVPLAFDPEGPLAPPPTLGVDPAADLVDDQRVQVTGSGFAPGESVALYECAGPIPASGALPNRCDAVRDLPLSADDEGAVDVGVRVKTVIAGTFGRVDCRTTACHLLARHRGPGRQVTVPLAFDPEVPPLDGRITVTPSRGLAVGQDVTIRGSGWRAGDVLLIALCHRRVTSTWRCANRTRVQVNLGPPDGGGPGVGFARSYRIRRWTTGLAYEDWDCLARRCVVLAHSASDSSDLARVELRYA